MASLKGKQAERYIQDTRVKALYSPYYFVHVVLKNKDLHKDLHGRLLERAIRRMKHGFNDERTHRHQGFQMFRGGLKTTTFTMGLSIWLVLPHNAKDRVYAVNELGYDMHDWEWRQRIKDVDYTQLIVFETFDNACNKVGEIRSHFESNDLFRACFPEIAYQGSERPWSDESIKIRRIGRNKHAEEGTFEAKGAGNALQSTHYDIIWEDDIVGEKALKSEVVMADTIEWHGRLTGVEQLGAKTWRFYVANPWGFHDLNSHVINQLDGEGKKLWEFATVPVYYTDPETGEEKPTWPEVYNWKVINQKRADCETEYDFYAQYLCDPRPKGEREIETERVHRYTVERGYITCSCGSRFHISDTNRYLLFDPYNAKQLRSKSLPAIVAVGLSADRHVVLLEHFMAKVSHSRLAEKIYSWNDKWKPRAFLFEDVGAQNMWAIYLKRGQETPDFKGANHKPLCRVVGVPAQNKPLDIRVRDYLVPILEAKSGTKFTVEKNHRLLFDMLDTFPYPVPKHDYDLLSALAMGPVKTKGWSGWSFPMSTADEEEFQHEEDAILEELGQPYSRMEVVHR